MLENNQTTSTCYLQNQFFFLKSETKHTILVKVTSGDDVIPRLRCHVAACVCPLCLVYMIGMILHLYLTFMAHALGLLYQIGGLNMCRCFVMSYFFKSWSKPICRIDRRHNFFFMSLDNQVMIDQLWNLIVFTTIQRVLLPCYTIIVVSIWT